MDNKRKFDQLSLIRSRTHRSFLIHKNFLYKKMSENYDVVNIAIIGGGLVSIKILYNKHELLIESVKRLEH